MARTITALEPTSTPPRQPLAARAWHVLKRLLLFGLLAAVLATALYLWAAAKFTYSSGERAGYVQKFSKKGWICKTWEGELAMANLPGALPEVFVFSLHDDAVAAEINKHLGSRVTLHYEQHLGLPSCFGETSYWVTSVRPVTQPATPPAP
jgi:hypothetical protein